jgi:hypothetical protein
MYREIKMELETNPKMQEYVKSLYQVFQMVYRKSEAQANQRLKIIAICIYNYTKFLSEKHNIECVFNNAPIEGVNLSAIFEYINDNSIQLYDFSTIKMEDLDVSDSKDLERFVLTHIYYLTQGK